MGKRIEYIDFIKGICIFIVVWGHSIQNMGDGNDFWTNPVHEFICSFHMPIFCWSAVSFSVNPSESHSYRM